MNWINLPRLRRWTTNLEPQSGRIEKKGQQEHGQVKLSYEENLETKSTAKEKTHRFACRLDQKRKRKTCTRSNRSMNFALEAVKNWKSPKESLKGRKSSWPNAFSLNVACEKSLFNRQKTMNPWACHTTRGRPKFSLNCPFRSGLEWIKWFSFRGKCGSLAGWQVGRLIGIDLRDQSWTPPHYRFNATVLSGKLYEKVYENMLKHEISGSTSGYPSYLDWELVKEQDYELLKGSIYW